MGFVEHKPTQGSSNICNYLLIVKISDIVRLVHMPGLFNDQP